MPKLTKNSRQHKRLDINFLVKYQTPSADSEAQLSNLMDLSRGGLSFLTNEYLEKDTKIHISVLIPSVDYPVQVEARVVRTFKVKAKRRTLAVAVEFTRVADKDKKALEKFLNRSTGEKKPLFVDLNDWVIRRK